MWRWDSVEVWRNYAALWQAAGHKDDAARCLAEADKLEAQLFDTRLEQA